MWFTVLIAVISLISLLILHEFGHFILAKKFGVEVEEFGIGYPPRLIGKKIGETIYSLNLLPFGAFVRIKGEEEISDDPRSFSEKPIWQRALIVFGGVLSFWIVAVIIFALVFIIGVPTAVPDELPANLADKAVGSPRVLIIGVAEDSPASKAGLEIGDRIISLKTEKENIEIFKVKDVQDFIDAHKGQEVTLEIQRGKEVFETTISPRVSPPQGEGAMGVALTRAAVLIYPWYEAPLRAIETSAVITHDIIRGLGGALFRFIAGKPSGVEIVGPIGIGKMISQHFTLGINYFLQFIAVIAVYLALFNLLPIPAVDGGRLLFLGIEKLKGRPINRKIEQNINGVFFALLLLLMAWVTIKDISNLF